jgi:hypothetical protein
MEIFILDSVATSALFLILMLQIVCFLGPFVVVSCLIWKFPLDIFFVLFSFKGHVWLVVAYFICDYFSVLIKECIFIF